jgi:CBS domain-containing protein
MQLAARGGARAARRLGTNVAPGRPGFRVPGAAPGAWARGALSWQTRAHGQQLRVLSTSAVGEAENDLGFVADLINIAEMERRFTSWTIDEDETVFEATRLMVERRTGCLCVTRAGEVVGIVTERDYLTKVLHAGRTSKSTKVKDIATMGDDLIVGDANESLQDALDVIVHRNVRHLPICRDGRIVALLGVEDLARKLADERVVKLRSLADLRMTMPIHDG